ncbi:hypothetical protein AD998_16620 [bacterium 336/3]|nr:hypothetical protein AD998_16620 [bacterium 336/3]
MLVEKLHLTQKKSRQIFCLFLAFFMFFLQGSANIQTLSFLSEKTAETEKEENRTEKESEDDAESEQTSIGKSKKAKKIIPLHFSFLLFQYKKSSYLPLPQIYFNNDWTIKKSLCFNPYTPSLFATPRYVAFHTLIFYES